MSQEEARNDKAPEDSQEAIRQLAAAIVATEGEVSESDRKAMPGGEAPPDQLSEINGAPQPEV